MKWLQSHNRWLYTSTPWPSNMHFRHSSTSTHDQHMFTGLDIDGILQEQRLAAKIDLSSELNHHWSSYIKMFNQHVRWNMLKLAAVACPERANMESELHGTSLHLTSSHRWVCQQRGTAQGTAKRQTSHGHGLTSPNSAENSLSRVAYK